MVAWAEEAIQTQENLLHRKDSLRIASTSWLAEAVLIPYFGKLAPLLAEQTSYELSTPNHKFELELLSGKVDFVICCHPPETPDIEHRQIAKESWVAIAPSSWRSSLAHSNAKELMRMRPYIKHSAINEDLFLPDLQIINKHIHIDNMIGIRTAVKTGLGWSIGPKILFQEDIKQGTVIDLNFKIPVEDRRVCLWWLRGHKAAKRKSAKIARWLQDILE